MATAAKALELRNRLTRPSRSRALVHWQGSVLTALLAFASAGSVASTAAQTGLVPPPPLALTVTRSADGEDPGSLRRAILDANSHPGLDTITFSVGTGGAQNLFISSNLPAITDPVIIDGTTQPGFTGTPLIRLRSSDSERTTETVGLTITGGGSFVRSLIIHSFRQRRFSSSRPIDPGHGIVLSEKGGNTVEGCIIGLDPAAPSSTQGCRGAGILIQDSPDNLIGGLNPTNRNVIGQCGLAGICITGASAQGNRIVGNHVGLDLSGTNVVENTGYGVLITNALNNIIGVSNVLAGNSLSDIAIRGGGASGNLVQGNLIGLRADGLALTSTPGAFNCIFIDNAPSNAIGGTSSVARNIIAGRRFGVGISGASANANVVQGNFIGTGPTGDTSVPTGTGVSISQASSNLIGGSQPGAGNVISGSQNEGIFLSAGSSNVIQGNIIGTGPDGLKVLGGRTGVSIFGGVGHTVGGTNSGEGNLITGCKEAAIILAATGTFTGSPATSTKILGNVIGADLTGFNELPLPPPSPVGLMGRSRGPQAAAGNPSADLSCPGNGAQGILIFASEKGDLSYNLICNPGAGKAANAIENQKGVNVCRFNHIRMLTNPGLDIDVGVDGKNSARDPGDKQRPTNPAELKSSAWDGKVLRITGTFEGAPNRTYLVDLYGSPRNDYFGYGESAEYYGSVQIETGSDGLAEFTASVELKGNPLAFVTALVTGTQWGTGESSLCIPILLGTPPAITGQPVSQTARSGAGVAFTVTAAGSDPLGYQWLKNGTSLPGATSSSLRLEAVQLGDAGDYTVVVSNAYGSTRSSPAILTVLAASEPPQFAPSADGNPFSLSFSGQPGNSYVVLATSDLKEWVPESWMVYSGRPTTLTFPISSGPAFRFYWIEDISMPQTTPCSEIICRGIPTGEQELVFNDCPGRAVCMTDCSVFLHSGEENFGRTDLAIPGRGDIHFVMARQYRSRLSYSGPLGFGWTFNYNERLFIEPNGDVVRFNPRSHFDTWTREPNGTFKAPLGNFRTLRRQANGLYVLREADGLQRVYRADGRLIQYQDRSGNRMSFGYDTRDRLKQATDPYGRVVEFVFETSPDGIDRLTRIRDFTGREVVYSYDSKGDLISVRTPVVAGTSTGNDFPNGRTERYTYSAGFSIPDLNHNLLSVTLPQEVAEGGPPAISWTYGTNPGDPVTLDRVIAETVGGTNASGIPAGGTTTIAYEMLNQNSPLGDPDVLRGHARITLRNGNIRDYFVNELNQHVLTRVPTRGLRSGEPANYETRSYFNTDGLLVRRVFPESNEVRYAYASTAPRPQQQNVVEARRIAGPRGGGEDQISTFTYEPLFNQLTSVTDPRGNSPSYSPPIGTRSADRYTTRLFYDYQESNTSVDEATSFGIDLATVPRNLGDLNADGRTDQAAGNLVRVQAPTVQLLPDSNEARRSGRTTQEILTEIQWNGRGQPIAVINPAGTVTEYVYNQEDDPDGDGRRVPGLFARVTGAAAGYLNTVVVDSRLSPRRLAQTPPEILETVYRYDAAGNTVAVRNPRGVLTEMEVNQLNETVKVIRGADVTEAIRAGQLLENEPPRRYLTQLFRDFNGRVVRTEVENRDSNTAGTGPFIEQTFAYDLLNDLVQSTAEVDASVTITNRYRYDPEQLPTLAIKPEGNTSAVVYDERNLPFQITQGYGSPDASTIQVGYDLNGNQQRLIDAEDNDGDGKPESTLLAYDGFDRVTTITDALGNQSLSEFDVVNNVVRVRAFGHPPNSPGAPNVLLADSSFRHDELVRVFQTDAALFVSQGFNPVRTPVLQDQNNDGFVTVRMEYDAASRPTFSVEDDGETTQLVYDGAGRGIETIDQLGNRRLVAYDKNSAPIRVQSVEVSPEGLVPNETFTTDYVRDQLGRVVRITDNAGQTARLTYDSRDLVVAQSDPEGPLIQDPLKIFPRPGQSGLINGPGNTTSFYHDGLGRLLRQVIDLRVGGTGAGALDTSNPFNNDGQITIAYQFDSNSRLRSITDDSGNPTRFGYDDLDRRNSQTNADGKSFHFVFDRDHNVRQATDPNGSVVTYTRDALHRLIQVDVNRGPGVVGTRQETYAYDGLSRLTRSTDDNGNAATVQTGEFVYDSLSHLLEERHNGKAFSSTYTGDGKRIAAVYPGGRTITNAFDAIDRITKIGDQNGVIAESFWIGPGYRELKRVNGNGTVLTFLNDAGNQDIGYDSVQRLVRLRCLTPTNTAFLDREYGYNRASQRLFETRHEDASLSDRFTYDSAYRLAQSQFDQNGLAGANPRDLTQIAYTLDGVGNRRQMQTDTRVSGAKTDSYSVNEVNEYTAITGLARAYDENGNLIDDGSRRLSFDYKNRLTAVNDKVSGNPIAYYFYQADNRRSSKTVFAGNSPPKETTFYYDGWRCVEERDGATDAQEVTYVYSPVYVDEFVEMERTSAHPLGAHSFYYLQDARADVVALTDAGGNLAEKFVYDDFGRPNRLSGIANPYLFQATRYDHETGFNYFRNRYYHAQEGRFIQPDPIGIWGDSANHGNAYTFSAGNPSGRDPMGLQEWNPAEPDAFLNGGKPATKAPAEEPNAPSLWDQYNTWFDSTMVGKTWGALGRKISDLTSLETYTRAGRAFERDMTDLFYNTIFASSGKQTLNYLKASYRNFDEAGCGFVRKLNNAPFNADDAADVASDAILGWMTGKAVGLAGEMFEAGGLGGASCPKSGGTFIGSFSERPPGTIAVPTLPVLEQVYENTCVPSCLTMLLEEYGATTSRSIVSGYLSNQTPKGLKLTPALDFLIENFETAGFTLRRGSLSEALRTRRAFIAVMDIGEGDAVIGHAVVVRSGVQVVDKVKFLTVRDPAAGGYLQSLYDLKGHLLQEGLDCPCIWGVPVPSPK